MAGASKDKIDYFIERTDKDLFEIKKAIADLNGFKFKLIGYTSAISTIVTILVTYLIKKM